MTEIICQWLNEELALSRRVDPQTFSREFCSGYLIGEVLHKYELQNDFDKFSQNRTATSKLNNFTRVEPTLQLLSIPFDQNVAQNIMSEQHGAATRLLYQLYIALQKKKRAGLTGVALETLRPAAPAKLQSIGTEMYKERLKTLVPRQSDLSLQQVTKQFELRAKEMEERLARLQNDEMKKIQKIQEELRIQDIEKLRRARRRQNEIMARIQAAIVHIPKPPANRTIKAIEEQKMLRKKKEAEEVYNELTKFEKSVKKDERSPIHSVTLNGRGPTLQRLRSTASIGAAVVKLDCSEDYVRKIQKRVEEDAVSREQREKRRRRILMEQLVAHGAQEEAFREEQLINRLMRQSQQERRIAVQLMHYRHEKEVMRQNRIFREKQYQERREREFQDALDREAAIEEQAKLDREDEIRRAQELYEQMAAERAQARYKKHYSTCQAIVRQIVDLVTKIEEYRELTNRLIPGKLMREWKEFFFTGLPLYEETSTDLNPEQSVELEKENLLDEKDYEEYKTMSGEWISSDTWTIKPAPNNNILSHVVHRLMNIIHPPPAPAAAPSFPPFPIKGCVLGNVFSGKSTCLRHLVKAYGVQVLSVDDLVQESIKACQEDEMEDEVDEPATNPEEAGDNKLTESFTAAPDRPGTPSSESATADKKTEDSSQPQTLTSPRDQEEPKERTLSRRAQLGGMMEKQLRKGKPVPDELLVQILVEAIKRLPAHAGWILDGFPVTVNQAKLLEKSLTGEEPEKNTTKSKKNKASALVEDPATSAEPPTRSPGLDFIVFIEVSDTAVLQRAAAMMGGITAAPGVGDVPPINQIPHRIRGFLDNWHRLEPWFSAQPNVLLKVDGEVEEAALCKKMEDVFLTALYNKQNQGKKPEKKAEIPAPPAAAAAPPPPSPPPPPQTTQDPPAAPSGKKASAKKGKGRSKSPKDNSVEKEDKKETPRGKDSAPKSGSPRGRSPGKKTKSTPATPEPPTPPPPDGPPPVVPGSLEWVYVDERLPQVRKEVPEFLAPYWETIESSYEKHVKVGLRSLRHERLVMIHHLHDVRSRFRTFLARPDHKQEFVSQWQNDFNCVAEDMREDEETRAELHQRVDDLRDRLWDIGDNRKEEAEQERAEVMSDGWLEDRLGILMNHFFSLMQVEVDRFQDTMRFLHDYYEGMENKIPAEKVQEFVRLPLLDISNPGSEDDSDNPRRIPLVPRRPPTPEVNVGKQRGKTAAAKGKEDPSVEVPGQPSEADQRLIHDTWQSALSAITNMVTAEKQWLEAEEEKDRQIMEQKDRDKVRAPQTASRDSQKGAKKKSPNRKKGGKSPGPAAPTPPPTAPEDNAELQKKQECKVRMTQEYLTALQCEEASVTSRLELIKVKALETCQEIVTRAEQAYKDMDMWLGAQYLAEMSSIGKLIQIAHYCVETRTRIQHELVLEQNDFYINSDIKVMPDPVPQPPPPPVETSTGPSLTVSQLRRLHGQFLQVAPSGLMSCKLFSDILMDITSVTLGDDALPDLWMHLSLSEVQEMSSAMSDGSDSVNWRKFLLSVSCPWPYPSLPELLTTLQRFKAVDDGGFGTVHEELYSQVELWFTGKSEETEPEDPTENLPFNRLEHLIRFFFHLFAESTQPPRLDYTDMLLYFASHPNPLEGFYRALSVVVGRPVLNPPDDNLLIKSLPAMDAIEENTERSAASDGGDIAPDTGPSTITLQEVLRVFQHGAGEDGDTHRFNQLERDANPHHKIIQNIFAELSPDALGRVSLPALLTHPIFHELVEDCQLYKRSDIQDILEKTKATQMNEGDSVTTSSTAS
ncbi:sperm flagellar protein 2 isoform 2-T2 [Anomaloglossus baeobatrachus]|uniref:sperm flagellar protein 2 isoform X2 n=1 Tax=Anomaloglossus baeobatrachus TaxID=238106 RepID=UPI003F506576